PVCSRCTARRSDPSCRTRRRRHSRLVRTASGLRGPPPSTRPRRQRSRRRSSRERGRCKS
ncbi:unnamed protein product, partial [Prorocentrum cordatum]